MGPLFLYSGSPSPHERRMLDLAAARPGRDPEAPLRVAVLLTPLENPPPRELRLMRGHFATQGIAAEVEDAGLATREDAFRPEVVDRLASADLVLISGGSSTRVYDATVGTPALAALERAWGAGAVVAGCSAGAVVMGRGHVRDWSGGRDIGDRWGWLGGLLVVPHYGRRDVSHWLDHFPGSVLLGIPNGAMALVDPRKRLMESLGPEPLWLIPAAGQTPIELPPGQSSGLGLPPESVPGGP